VCGVVRPGDLGPGPLGGGPGKATGQPHVVGLRGLREVLVDKATQYVVTIDSE